MIESNAALVELVEDLAAICAEPEVLDDLVELIESNAVLVELVEDLAAICAEPEVLVHLVELIESNAACAVITVSAVRGNWLASMRPVCRSPSARPTARVRSSR